MTEILSVALVALVVVVAFALVGALVTSILVAFRVIPIDAIWIYRFSRSVRLDQSPSGKVVKVTGRLRAPPGEAPLRAPFSGRACLYHRTELEVPFPDPDQPFSSRADHSDGLDELWLVQGELHARVIFRGGLGSRELHLSEQRELIFENADTAAVARWLEERGLRIGDVLDAGGGSLESYRIRQRLIEPGEQALVGGRIERRPGVAGAVPSGYREPPMETVLEPPRGRNDTPLLLVTDERLIRRLGGRSARTLTG